METAIVSIICIALMILGGMTMSQDFMSTADSTTAGFEEMNEMSGEIYRSSLSLLSADMASANVLEVSLRNSGQTKIADFDKWDVIIEYWAGSTKYIDWYLYTDGTIDNNKWIVEGIYNDAESEDAEGFEPGILNPGEEIIIQAKLVNEPDTASDDWVNISTPYGVSASGYFTYP